VYRHLRRVTPALMMIQRTARELNAWSKLKHPNVLELLGLAQFHDCLAMVSPWMEYGSVMAVIQKSPHLDRYKMVSETSDVYQANTRCLTNKHLQCGQLVGAVAYLHGEKVVRRLV
jgi:serine/threonine protein kinase